MQLTHLTNLNTSPKKKQLKTLMERKMGSATEQTITPVQVSDDEANLFAMQLASCSVLPMVLQAALELDLLEIMAKNTSPMSPAEIASHLSTKNPEAPLILARILRLLAAYSILTSSVRTLPGGDGVERLYGLGPVCKYLIKNEDGVSIAPLCLMTQDKVFMQSWYHLKDSILVGGAPFNKAYGMSVSEYKRTDTRFSKVVNNGMSNYSTISIKKILETYKGFDGLTTLVDVGGGSGATLQMIVSKYPNLKCINFDLPHVIKDAPSYPGIEHVGGDYFVSVPKGDAMFMKWICHARSDEQCLKFLKNCYDSLPENGKVIVCECILSETLDSSLLAKEAVHVDCIMLAQTGGGIERTEREFEVLAKGSGFHGIKVVCNAFGIHIIEFLKQI